jgi:hypothetical protein
MAELTVTVVDPACGEALPLGFREQLARVVEAP